MTEAKKQLLSKVRFIEEHSEYTFEQYSKNIWNDMLNFVSEHYEEVYNDYQLELCGYVDIEY